MMAPRWISHPRDAKARLDYLTGLKDKAGRIRYETPLVLAGSPAMFLRATRAWWWQRHKFSESGLAFGERIPKAELDEVRREYETVITGGMRDRTYFLWVLHQSPSEMHLHFLCLNVELHSRNDFVPYFAPHDRDRLDTYQQIVNTARGYLNPRTRLAAREVLDDSSKKGAVVEVLDASRGRRNLESELIRKGYTIKASRSGVIRYFDPGKGLCEVAGVPLRDSWIVDPAARLRAQIAHLQMRMDEKCQRLQRAYGHAERVDVRTLPSVKVALKMIERLEASPPQDIRQRITARLEEREKAKRPSTPISVPAPLPPLPLPPRQVAPQAPRSPTKSPKPPVKLAPQLPDRQTPRQKEQNVSVSTRETSPVPQPQASKPRSQLEPRQKPKLNGDFTM